MTYTLYSVYDRHENRFDFVDDEDHEHYLEYTKEEDTLVVRQWCSENKTGGMHPVIAVFYQPIRYTKDVTL
jgi:hypothetical protein